MNQPASNVTLKHPTGPWWTIYGTAQEIAQQIALVFPHLGITNATDFPVMVAQASAEWATLVGATSTTPNNSGGNQGNGSGGWGNSSGGNQSANQNQPGPGNAPRCNHGEMKYVSGNGAKGPWQGWFCPQPKDAVDKCRPEWIKS